MSPADLFGCFLAVAAGLPIVGASALLTVLVWLAILGWVRGARPQPPPFPPHLSQDEALKGGIRSETK